MNDGGERGEALAARLESHQPHVPELQSIRGVAALVVAIGHCISYYAAPGWWAFVKHLVNTSASVEIFFVLSGYVLVLSLSRRAIGRPEVTAFYVKRLFRIYPGLLFASAIALAYIALLHYRVPVPGVSEWMSARFRFDRYTPLLVTASFAGFFTFLLPPAWTIFVEIVASTFMPGLAFLLRERPRGFWAVWAGLLALSLVLAGRLPYHVDLYLFDFALGASLLRIDPAPLRRAAERGLPLRLLVALAALLLVGTRAFLWVDPWDRWVHLYEIALAAFIVFCFGRVGLVSPTLRGRPAVWLGDISYSIYLVHFTVMCVIAKALAILFPGAFVALGGIGLGLVLSGVTVSLSLWLSDWSYRRIEKPGIAAGGQVLRRIFGAPPTRAVA